MFAPPSEARRVVWEELELGRRALYRRVLAILRGGSSPFVVAGPLGISVHLGELLPGDLEVFIPPAESEVITGALTAAGFRIEAAPGELVVGHEHRLLLAWNLPAPLGGDVDEAWFAHSTRHEVLDLRVRVAAVEELLWLRIAVPGAASIGDPVIPRLLLVHSQHLDWDRLLARLAGLEELLLAHLFLFRHEHPGDQAIPARVFDKLLQGGPAAAGR